MVVNKLVDPCSPAKQSLCNIIFNELNYQKDVNLYRSNVDVPNFESSCTGDGSKWYILLLSVVDEWILFSMQLVALNLGIFNSIIPGLLIEW